MVHSSRKENASSFSHAPHARSRSSLKSEVAEGGRAASFESQRTGGAGREIAEARAADSGLKAPAPAWKLRLRSARVAAPEKGLREII